MALCLGVLGSACGSEAAKPDSSASPSSSPKSDGSSKAAKNDKKDDKKADAKKDDAKKDDAKKDDKEAKNDKKDDVDVDSLLDDKDDKEEAGALKINIEEAKDDAPTIGGSEPPPAEHNGVKLSWEDAGSFMIPNPGMKKEETKELMILELPDKKGGAIFTTFKDAAEAKKKVEDITTAMKLKEFKWKQKPKPVTLGPDKIPAMLGGGHAIGADGKGGKLAYALIKGTPNILAIIGVDDDAPKADMEQAFSSIAYIKKKH